MNFGGLLLSDASTYILIISILASMFIFVLRLLNSSNKESKDPDKRVNENIRISNIEGKVEELNDHILSIGSKENKISEEDRNYILRTLEEKIRSEASQNFIDDIENKIKKTNLELIFNEKVEKSIDRLTKEKNSAFFRGNFNLTIGFMISIIGGSIAYTFIQKLPIAATTVELFSYTLPRLSFFMLIILLAFFFLNLYRKSMEDIKYYQNEITNLEAKYLSLQMSKSMNNHKLISSILQQLVKTERNFVLEKGQSTIELEKERISSNNANNTLQAVKDIFQSKK